MKTWFITGIVRGLGRDLAQAALRCGDTVIGTTRDGAAPALTGSRGALHVLRADLADTGVTERAVAEALALSERVDVIVNNAGYGLLGAAEAASDAEVARLFEVNVFAPFRLIRGFLPRLRDQGAGHVINITSIAGRAPMASSALYAAAKSKMEGLSHALAQEVAPLGVRVTAVAPGGFRTDFLTPHSIRRSGGMADIYGASVGKALDHLDAIAGRQLGDPRRAAEAILRLADSPEPPVHLLLGSDALRRTRERMAGDAAEMERWEETTRGTDFAEQDA